MLMYNQTTIVKKVEKNNVRHMVYSNTNFKGELLKLTVKLTLVISPFNL